MRLVTYLKQGEQRPGVLVGDRVVDAAEAAAAASVSGAEGLNTVRDVLRVSDEQRARIGAGAVELAPTAGQDVASLTLGPPVPDPDKIICVGLNYLDHAEEAQMSVPEWPVLFTKYRNVLIGEGQAVEVSDLSHEWDFEAELGVVIGKQASGVSADEALDYVAGYMPFNDVSARDVQLRSPQWTTGKSLDRTGPCGPALVLTDEVPDPQDLQLRFTLNGVVLQESSTSKMLFSVATLVEYISRYITLEPGDIIATGTPAGVGFKREPPVRLEAGDVMVTEIDGIGTLTTPIVARAPRTPSSSTNEAVKA